MVGSGPAGVAAARTLIDGGVYVDMLDFGNEEESDVAALAARLRNAHPTHQDLALVRPPTAEMGFTAFASHMWAMARGRAPLLNLMQKTRLGSGFAFRDVQWAIPTAGTGAPISRSLARGGLSNVWGAACYALAPSDYETWPVNESEMAPHYAVAARLLSLAESADDLDTVYPIYSSTSGQMPWNPAAERLYEHWAHNRRQLGNWGFRFGRARLAVRTEDDGHSLGCQRCGLCLAGCPYDAIYRADWTLSELMTNARFRYRNRAMVHSYREEGTRVLVQGIDVGTSEPTEHAYDALFLAAGTLSTLRIAAVSSGHVGRPVQLLDNDLYVLPLLRTVGASTSAAMRFSLNELVLRTEEDGCPVHIQLYAASSQVINRFRPLLNAIPTWLGKHVEAPLSRLTLAFLYLPGSHSAHITATVERESPMCIRLTSQRNTRSHRIARKVAARLFRARGPLGLVPVCLPLRATPTGNSGGHVAGSVPMRESPAALQSDLNGRLHESERVYVVDGSSLPYLPAQNSTYTVMANAHRIADLFARS